MRARGERGEANEGGLAAPPLTPNPAWCAWPGLTWPCLGLPGLAWPGLALVCCNRPESRRAPASFDPIVYPNPSTSFTSPAYVMAGGVQSDVMAGVQLTLA